MRASCADSKGASGRQAHDERCSAVANVVVAENFAGVFLYDAITNAEPEAGSFTNFLGGEKWIENFVGMANAGTVVGEGNFDGLARLGSHDLDTRRAADGLHCVVSVVQDVEKDLL